MYVVRRESGAPDWRSVVLASEAYTTPEVLAREQERLFARTWVLAGMAEQVRNPGDYFTVDIGREPILVVRETRTEVRAFYNVCRHRGRRLVDQEAGHDASGFTCSYHAWTYDRDGALRSMADEGEYPGVDACACGLTPVQCAVWNGLVFVHLDPEAPPLATYLDVLPECLNERIEPGVVVRRERHEFNVNWKVPLEAFIEPRHQAALPPTAPLDLDWTQAAVQHFRRHSMQVVPEARATNWKARRGGTWKDWLADPRYLRFHYTIFPNVNIHVLIQGLTFVFRCLPHPTAPERMTLDLWVWARVRAGRPLPEPMSLQEAQLDSLQEEYAHLEPLHEGVRSRGFRCPTLSAYDSRIGHFHAVWDAYMQAGAGEAAPWAMRPARSVPADVTPGD